MWDAYILKMLVLDGDVVLAQTGKLNTYSFYALTPTIWGRTDQVYNGFIFSNRPVTR